MIITTNHRMQGIDMFRNVTTHKEIIFFLAIDEKKNSKNILNVIKYELNIHSTFST